MPQHPCQPPSLPTTVQRLHRFPTSLSRFSISSHCSPPAPLVCSRTGSWRMWLPGAAPSSGSFRLCSTCALHTCALAASLPCTPTCAATTSSPACPSPIPVRLLEHTASVRPRLPPVWTHASICTAATRACVRRSGAPPSCTPATHFAASSLPPPSAPAPQAPPLQRPPRSPPQSCFPSPPFSLRLLNHDPCPVAITPPLPQRLCALRLSSGPPPLHTNLALPPSPCGVRASLRVRVRESARRGTCLERMLSRNSSTLDSSRLRLSRSVTAPTANATNTTAAAPRKHFRQPQLASKQHPSPPLPRSSLHRACRTHHSVSSAHEALPGERREEGQARASGRERALAAPASRAAVMAM